MSDATSSDRVVFRNVRVFDGRSEQLSEASDVVVSGSLIEAVGAADGTGAVAETDTRVIDGRGGVLMPGLIDAHWHAMFATVTAQEAVMADIGYLNLKAGHEAERTLLRGFTTVRDAGGPSFGLKRAIDEGVVAGPRIYPSGAFISQTSGHGDFRIPIELPYDPSAPLSHVEAVGGAAIADGVDEVLRAVRGQLMLGASQIKLMAGGGVVSNYDPIDVTQYTVAELRAAVDAATDWGTYVMVHAYTPRSVGRAIEAGVRCIEHGQLLDEDTVARMAGEDVWWNLQPFLDDDDAAPVPPGNRAKQLAVFEGTDRAYQLARKHGVKLAWSTDTLFDAALTTRQGSQLVKMRRWFSPAEVLTMATSRNAELLAMSGERNPYPGPLGVVAPGALADLILVDGNPLENLDLVADPAEAFVVIMKDGVVHKNTTGTPRTVR